MAGGTVMKNRLSILVFLIVAILTLVFVLAFKETFRDVIVIPLLSLFWLVNLVIKSIDQTAIWILFLIGIGYIILRSLGAYRTGRKRSRQSEPTRIVHGRVKVWTNLFQYFDNYGPLRDHFLRVLKVLILAVLSEQQHIQREEIDQEKESKEPEIPREIQASLQPLQASTSLENPDIRWRIREALKRLKAGRKASLSSFDSHHLENLISYLEGQLEISHDNDNR